jgi:hypothetical protein
LRFEESARSGAAQPVVLAAFEIRTLGLLAARLSCDDHAPPTRLRRNTRIEKICNCSPLRARHYSPFWGKEQLMRPIRNARMRSRALRIAIDALESRRLLSAPEATLTLYGTAAADDITLNFVGGSFEYTLNGTTSYYPSDGVTLVQINALAGGDWINIERNGGVATDIYGGDSADEIHLSYYQENLSNVPGYCRVYGGGGLDVLTAWDRAAGAATYGVNWIDVTRPGFGGVLYGGDVEDLGLYTSTSGSTVNVASTYSATDLRLFVSGTSNVVRLGDTGNGVQGIVSAVGITGLGGGTTDLVVDNTGDGDARNVNLDIEPDNYALLNGLAQRRGRRCHDHHRNGGGHGQCQRNSRQSVSRQRRRHRSRQRRHIRLGFEPDLQHAAHR